MTRYWLRADHQTRWDEVSKADYVAAERNAGFHNTLGQPEEPATSAFSGKGMNGRTFSPVPEPEGDQTP